MRNTYPLFIMLSQTSSYIGKGIRFFNRYRYNHVSLSLDPTLQHWVSFARYVKGVPLAGGFVREDPSRFLDMKGSVPVKIYRIDISEARHQKLTELFSHAGEKDFGLIYNTFDIIAALVGRKYSVPGAYTCLDFACTVLEHNFDAIQTLDETLEAPVVFEGDLKTLLEAAEGKDDPYFTHRGFLGGTRDTAWHFTRLTLRVFRRSRYQDPVKRLLN